jgi:hypothetical protein
MRLLQRGRAIVRRLPSRAEGRTYRPGDFVLLRSEGALARALGLATGGQLNHAALIVDPSGGLIEATPHALPGASALRRTHLANYLAAGTPCWVGYVELQEGTRQSVVEFAEWHYNAQSTLSEIGLLALMLHVFLCVAPRARAAHHSWLRGLRPLFDRYALVLREEHTYLSGELVARALERGGFLWDMDPSHITPAELFARFHLRDESDSGVLVSLTHARRVRKSNNDAPAGRGPAQVSRFVPRAQRLAPAGRREAAVRAAASEPDEQLAPAGLRALIQVALLGFGSLTLAYGIQLLGQALRQE